MKWTPEERDYYTKRARKWLKSAQMDRWDIDLEFTNAGNGYSAEAGREVPYRKGSIKFRPKVMKKDRGRELDVLMVHEIIHIILGAMREYRRDIDAYDHAEEEAADLLAQWIVSVVRGEE